MVVSLSLSPGRATGCEATVRQAPAACSLWGGLPSRAWTRWLDSPRRWRGRGNGRCPSAASGRSRVGRKTSRAARGVAGRGQCPRGAAGAPLPCAPRPGSCAAICCLSPPAARALPPQWRRCPAPRPPRW